MRRLLTLCVMLSTTAQEWQSPDHMAKYGRAFMGVKEFKWRPSPAFLKRANQLASDEQDIYQFGVYTGGTMVHMNNRIKAYRRMWGFDSFQGLPPETNGIRIEGKHWLPGGFSSKGALKANTSEEAMRRVAAKLNNTKATLVRGFFNESLPTMDLSACRPALLVDIDSDLYVSAKQALTWLFRHKIARVGTLIRYDDWNAGDPSWGEARAHKEISEEFGVTFWSFSHREFEVMSVAR